MVESCSWNSQDCSGTSPEGSDDALGVPDSNSCKYLSDFSYNSWQILLDFPFICPMCPCMHACIHLSSLHTYCSLPVVRLSDLLGLEQDFQTGIICGLRCPSSIDILCIVTTSFTIEWQAVLRLDLETSQCVVSVLFFCRVRFSYLLYLRMTKIQLYQKPSTYFVLCASVFILSSWKEIRKG